MRRPVLTMYTMVLATVLASSALVFVLSGVSKAGEPKAEAPSEAETSSEVKELTESPVPASPSKKKRQKDVIPALQEKFPAYSRVVDNAKKPFSAPKLEY